MRLYFLFIPTGGIYALEYHREVRIFREGIESVLPKSAPFQVAPGTAFKGRGHVRNL